MTYLKFQGVNPPTCVIELPFKIELADFIIAYVLVRKWSGVVRVSTVIVARSVPRGWWGSSFGV